MKIVPSVLVGSMSGSAGDVTAATWKGRLYARRRVIPANPQSAAQVLQREAFSRCVACYQALPNDIKTYLDLLGSDEALSGYNIMMRGSVADEKGSHGHVIVPPNRYADAIAGFSADTGAGAAGTAVLTWTAGDWLVTDTADVYYRLKDAVGDEYATPWTQMASGAIALNTGTFTTAALTADTDYMFALVPYNTVAASFGAGAFDNATTVAA